MINSPVYYNPVCMPPLQAQKPQSQTPVKQSVIPTKPVPANKISTSNTIMDKLDKKFEEAMANGKGFTKEEEKFVEENPTGDIVKFNLDRKDYKRAVQWADISSGKERVKVLEKYLNEPAFDSLAQSKFFNNMANFERLVDIVSTLAKERNDAYQKVHSPGYRSCTIPDVTRIYADIDIGNCIKNLDRFFKSEAISDDLKTFICEATDKLSDLNFVNYSLGKENLTVKDLTNKRYFL